MATTTPTTKTIKIIVTDIDWLKDNGERYADSTCRRLKLPSSTSFTEEVDANFDTDDEEALIDLTMNYLMGEYGKDYSFMATLG